MKYLKLTIRTNRRRIQIEQLILLALRTLLIVILVLAVARPVLAKVGLGSWLARRARVSRVIVVDTAMNTGYRAAGQSALDREKAAVAEIIANGGSQDAITVLTTTPGAQPIAKEAGPEATARVAAAVRDLRATDAAANWAATFKQIDDALSTATFPEKQLILVTDLRRSGWRTGGAAVTQLADHWAATGVSARVVDCGSRETADVALARLAQDDALALPEAPVKLSASIRNGTASPVVNATATLTVDGDRRPVLLPPLPAGATTDVPLAVTFDRAGFHALSLSLPDDALAADGVRWLGVDVRDRLDLTILDGKVGAGPLESAGDFFQGRRHRRPPRLARDHRRHRHRPRRRPPQARRRHRPDRRRLAPALGRARPGEPGPRRHGPDRLRRRQPRPHVLQRPVVRRRPDALPHRPAHRRPGARADRRAAGPTRPPPRWPSSPRRR